MRCVTWGDFRSREPELSELVGDRLTAGLCYLATVRADGHPRVHPVGVNPRDGQLIVPMRPSSPKGHDLRRTGRFALHCTVEDSSGGAGEVLVSGLARECDAAEEFSSRGWITFDLGIGEVLVVTNGGSGARVTRWRADGD